MTPGVGTTGEAAQGAAFASDLDKSIARITQRLSSLERGLRVSRSSGHASRIRTQVKAHERELADLNRMRSELRKRFGV